MLPRIKELKKFEAYGRRKKIRSVLKIDGNECKQAIPVPDGAYCGIWREKISGILCKCCPYFDREPLEYRLFRRT